MRLILAVTLASLLAACQPAPSASDAAKDTATAVSGEGAGAAATNTVCALYTPAELSAQTGLKLGNPSVAAMGSGCQWMTADGEADAMIQIVGADYHEPHTGAKDFKTIDVGQKGFVQYEMESWGAGAISDGESVNVSVSGPNASAASAEALLRETIKRRSAQKS